MADTDTRDATATTYTIPLEVGFEDVRECRIDESTTCADVLTALLGRPKDRAGGAWAILETVYERGVLNVQTQPKPAARSRRTLNVFRKTKLHASFDKKAPQLIIKELRLLEPTQPMHELVRDVSGTATSTLSVINASCEIVVFFNPYFRMLTGLPLSHVSLFPDPEMSIRQFNRMIRGKLGLSPDDDRFALHGFYGRHVARLEDRCIVGRLKTTWESGSGSDSNDAPPNVAGFFQFQAVQERIDNELLGVERASWLYVKRESGIIQSTRKLYCVLKGTTLFVYRKSSRVAQIDSVDSCRVLNLGPNLFRTRHYFQVVEAVCRGKQQRPTTWTFSSPYPSRVRKWLRVLGRCRRTFESQTPVTHADPDGEEWMRGGRGNAESRRPFSKRSYRHRNQIDPSEVPAGEMTGEQRSRFDHIDALLRAATMSAEVVKKAGCEQTPELAIDWMEKIRTFALEATGLLRPGFASKIVPNVKMLLRAVNKFAPALSGSLRAALMSSDAVDAVNESCEAIAFVYKQHILDLASFPASPTRHEMEWGPQLVGLRMVLEDEQFFEHVVEEETRSPGHIDSPNDATAEDNGDDQEVADMAASDADTVVAVNEGLGDDTTEEQLPSELLLDQKPSEEAASEKDSHKRANSLVRKMKKLLVSARPEKTKTISAVEQMSGSPAKEQLIIEIDPESPTRTELSEPQAQEQQQAIDATVNESLPPFVPSRTAIKNNADSRDGATNNDSNGNTDNSDAGSTTSSRSSFSQRAKAMWARVSSPLSRATSDLKSTATFPPHVRAEPIRPGRKFTTGDAPGDCHPNYSGYAPYPNYYFNGVAGSMPPPPPPSYFMPPPFYPPYMMPLMMPMHHPYMMHPASSQTEQGAHVFGWPQPQPQTQQNHHVQ